MAQVNFRVDDEVKKKAERACNDMGISMSTAINIFLVKVGNERRIPFEVTADNFEGAWVNRGRLMKKLWEDDAWEEYISFQSDKRMIKKINSLLKSIDRNGYNCIGKPEPLMGNLSGYWSVRIDSKNRIVFRIENNNIEIIQCGTHYQDK